jgi:hypothetical protein
MNIKQLFLAATIFAATTAASAQDYPQNVVKLGLEGLAPLAAPFPLFPQINLHYERMINARQGANIMVGIGLAQSLSNTVIADINTKAAETATTTNTQKVTFSGGTLNSFEVVAEYRFYLSSQEGPRGFYVAPQVYYKNFNGTLKGSHITKTNPRQSVDQVKLDINFLDIGGQIGAQWLINDKISIDWQILGIGAGFNNATFSGSTDDKSEVIGWANQLTDLMNTRPEAKSAGTDASNILKDASSGTITLKTPFLPLYLRGGLSVGYAF